MNTKDTNKEVLVRLGHKVKVRRAELGLSQEELSDIAGLHRTYISQLEKGLRNPTYKTLVKIAKSLKIKLPDLMER